MVLTRDPTCPALPAELWVRILSYHTDLVHLWNACRLVSPTFRDLVEQVFAQYHMRHVFVDFQLDRYNLGGNHRGSPMRTVFHKFSPDKSYVHFHVPRGFDGNGELSSLSGEGVMERFSEQVETSKPETPNYTIQLEDMVNDTALPDLRLTEKSGEILFDWRGMCRTFFREQEGLRILRQRWEYAALNHGLHSFPLSTHVSTDCSKLADVPRMTPDQQAAEAKKVKGLLPKDGVLTLSGLASLWPKVEMHFRKLLRRLRLKGAYEGCQQELWALDALQYFDDLEPGAKIDDIVVRLVESRKTSRFFDQYALQCCKLDEESSLHRVEMKIQSVGKGG